MRLYYTLLLLLLHIALLAGEEPANPAKAVPPESGISGFFSGLNKKTKEIKDAVDKAAGNNTPSNPSSRADTLSSRSEAPVFNNDKSTELSPVRIAEVLGRNYEWGDVGPNTSGYKQMGPPLPSRLEGISSLKWKSSREECLTFLKERGATITTSTTAKPGVQVISFEGGSFAGQTAKAWQLLFFKSQLFEAKVEFYHPRNDNMRQYRVMLAELEKKYGPHTGEQDLRFLYLDLDKDYAIMKRNSNGDEEKHWYFLMVLDSQYATSLVNNSAQPMARWVFADDDTLTFWISGRFTTLLQYRSNSLALEANTYAETKSSSEKDL